MTVQIDWDRTRLFDDEIGGGVLYLTNPSTDTDYHSFPFYETDEDAVEKTAWDWENPKSPIGDVTLSPSIEYKGGIGPNFHIYIRHGEIEHLSDCKCGCPA